MCNPLLGQLLALASAFAFASANLCISRTQQSRGDKGTIFSVIVTLLLAFVVWLVLESRSLDSLVMTDKSLIGIGWFVLAGLSAMVFGRSLLFASVRILGVSRSSAVKRLNPFFSVILAALILGETISGPDFFGMGFIALAFGLLIYDVYVKRGMELEGATEISHYLYGLFAALAYAAAYVMRKLGLNQLPDPALGTFISALSGLCSFYILSFFSQRRRDNFRNVFRHLDRWIVSGAIMMSSGQILLFAALAYERVSNVVMISSLEVFISIILSVIIFRSEKWPGMWVVMSASFAMVGVIIVASA